MIHTAYLLPVTVLIAWSLIMWLWMYVTRLPAIIKSGQPMDPMKPKSELLSFLPAQVAWKADNYNHLMEQPTIFYAACFVLALLPVASSTALTAAWVYVLLRVIHSLVQALANAINLRFSLHVLGTLPLFVMVWAAAGQLLR